MNELQFFDQFLRRRLAGAEFLPRSCFADTVEKLSHGGRKAQNILGIDRRDQCPAELVRKGSVDVADPQSKLIDASRTLPHSGITGPHAFPQKARGLRQQVHLRLQWAEKLGLSASEEHT